MPQLLKVTHGVNDRVAVSVVGADRLPVAAEQLAREAVDMLRSTDARVKQADALMDLAEVLVKSGQFRAAQAVVEESEHLYRAKQSLVQAETRPGGSRRLSRGSARDQAAHKPLESSGFCAETEGQEFEPSRDLNAP